MRRSTRRLGSTAYRRARDKSLWLIVPDDSPLAESAAKRRDRARRRRDEPDCMPEADAVVAFERRDDWCRASPHAEARPVIRVSAAAA